MRKYTYLTILFLFALFVLRTDVLAQIVTKSRSSFNLPLVQTQQEENFGRPNAIYIVPFVLDDSVYVSSEEWYKGFFYYQAMRLNQGDFLVHYVVTEDGNIWEGNEYGEVQRFGIEDPQNIPVIIAYLADSDSGEFSNEAKNALGNLVVDIANRNQLELSQVYIKNVTYIATSDRKIITRIEDASALWSRGLASVVASIENKYNPDVAASNISLSLAGVDLPDTAVNYGQDIIVDVTVKNDGTTAIYEDTQFELLASKVGSGFSIFSINDLWLTPSSTSIMADGDSLLPNETKTFRLRIRVPLYFGQQTETFQLTNAYGDPYFNTTFNISLNINRLNKEAVEIVGSSVYIYVREQPDTVSPAVTKVSPGQRFVVVERSNGYVKIDIGNGKIGWVPSGYTAQL